MENENKRSSAKRSHLVDAAALCFETNGFHATSMAQISAAASMSAGHIYHYFPGKEALIAAIVEVKLDEAFSRMDDAEKIGLYESLVSVVQINNFDQNDRRQGELSMWLEIFAEGRRNPKIAELIRKADTRFLQRQREVFRRFETGEIKLSEAALNARLEVFNVLIQGLPIRALCNPQHDTVAFRALMETVLKSLIVP